MAFPGLVIAVILLFSFRTLQPTAIKGEVTPAWYGVHAWAISESDTLYTDITDGNFEFSNAQPGTYRIVIEARPPYRHMQIDGIVVTEGQTTDAGQLSLQKWE